MDESKPSECLNWPEIGLFEGSPSQSPFEGSPMSTNVYGRVSKTCGSITSLSWVYHVPITSPTMGVYHVPIRCSPHQFVTHAHSRRLCIVGTRTSSAHVGADVLPEPVGNCRWRSVWTTSTRAGDLAPVGTERCGVLSGLTSAWERAACVMYAIMWCLAKATRDCYHSAYIWVSLHVNNHIMVSLMCVFKL